MAAIGAALRRPDLAAVLITGDAGVGKSRLLDATLQQAEHAGFATVAITGTRALADIPLAAFAAMLPQRLAGDAGDLVQIRRILQDRAGGRPLLLGVDDAQLLDDASAAVTYQLATDLTAFVVATVRSGEIPPDAITALHKDGLAARVSLDPLGRDDLDAFARATLHGAIDPAVGDQLWQRTLGNPLFARELLLQARETGTIVLSEGAWRLAADFVAPESLADLVESRLAGLSERHQRAAALIAVGGPLEIELLERLVDPDVLVELEEARVVAADEVDDRLVVRFVHPVYADATRRRVGRLTARGMLRELATTLDATPKQRPEDVLRIATWRLDAGADADPHLLLQAARLATRRNDFALAERLALHAFEEEPSLPAAVTVAAALVEQGRYDEAAAILYDERVDRSTAAPHDRHRAAMIETSVQYWGLGSLAGALAVLDRAEADHPELADLVASTRASLAASSGRPLEAMAFAPLGSAAAQTPFGIATVLLALTATGTPDTALTAIGAIPDAGRASAASVVHVAYGFALTEAGRVEEAMRVGVEGWERALREGDLHGRVAWSIANGWADLNLGRRTSAKRWFDEAAELARHSAAAIHGVRWALGGSLLASALAGDVDAASSLVARLDAMPAHDAVVHAHMEDSGRVWLLAAQQGPQAAITELERLAAAALTFGNTSPRLRHLIDIARLGRPDLAVSLLDAGPHEVDGAFLPALVRAIRALAGTDATATAAVADELWAAGCRVLAAEMATRAWEQAQGSIDDARAVAQFGRRAQELREAIDDFATPALTTSSMPEISLSRREREIAMLVAEGRTSREVADELIIGVRTVESHLARIYAKLGVRSRAELSAALGLTGATA